jgi:hypothetical protein
MEEQPHIVDEIKKMAHESLLSVEKKLIAWSLISGVVLLVVLVLVSRIFIHAAP